MKVKIFQNASINELEELVNEFISNADLEIIKMDYAANNSGYSVMITYKYHGFLIETEEKE